MANPNSKLHHAPENPLSVFLMTFILFLALITKAKSDSLTFNIPKFESDAMNLLLAHGAKISGGVLQLTEKDHYGNPSQHKTGLSAFLGLLHLSDRKTGRVASFATEFSFVVNTKGAPLHGDGFTFYLASRDFEFPSNSSGGFFGLFNEKTAFNTSLNQVVVVEFDSFANEWDPNFPLSDSPHIGIDINSIRSVATAPWPLDIENQSQGSIGVARISYHSSSKILTVSLSYPNSPVRVNTTVLSYPVNLGVVLPEWVLFGFTATTGDLVETHDILSWSFRSFL